MSKFYESLKKNWQTARSSIYTKWFFRIILIALTVTVIAYLSMAWYINKNNKEVLASLTAQLNENISGSLIVESMEPTFLEGFPLLSLNMRNVVITDSLYHKHGQVLLRANNFDISVNSFALLRGVIEIKNIAISDASINIYTDSSGYSNTSAFKKSKSNNSGNSGGYPEVRKFILKNVALAIDNKFKNKLFQFNVKKLKGGMNYDSRGWEADIDLKTHVQSLAFNTRKGSFIKGSDVNGNLHIMFESKKGILKIDRSELEIGGQDFTIGGTFELGPKSSKFKIEINNDKILWRDASRLLAANISSRLNRFNLLKPISVSCNIAGDLNEQGDPLIHVNAKIRNNTLTSPGGTLSECTFDGEFINNHIDGKGFNDANSAVRLYNIKGLYSDIPIEMKKVFILDFDNPIAVGDFTSKFDISKLSRLIDSNLINFGKGKADVKLSFTADIVNFKIAKPIVAGVVSVKDANIVYVPRNLSFKNISVALNFKDDDLFISKIHLQNGKSIVDMEGKILNFLNLYYQSPDKIVLNWNVRSSQLHLDEFIGFLTARNQATIKKKSANGNFTAELNELFENSNVDLNIVVDKLYYDKFYASNVAADVYLSNQKITLKNAGLNHADGSMKVNGTLLQKKNGATYKLDAVVRSVNISKFFDAFSSFGLQSLTPKNLQGFVSVKTKLSGNVTDKGALVPKSLNGNVLFSLRKAALLNFDPVKNIGNLVFPFRDMNTISITSLDGEFDINGEKVRIFPLKINSSVLNMDMEGIYSFGRGTEIYLSVPIRNPKRDEEISDKDELAKRRKRGIVVNLVAKDDKDGKVKIGLGKKDEVKTE